MSTIAGELLWNHQRISMNAGSTLGPAVLAVDTGLTQVSLSLVDPPMGISGPTVPADGALPASRIQVLPQAPLDQWSGLTHSEPWFNTTTNTVWVTFANTKVSPIDFNV